MKNEVDFPIFFEQVGLFSPCVNINSVSWMVKNKAKCDAIKQSSHMPGFHHSYDRYRTQGCLNICSRPKILFM